MKRIKNIPVILYAAAGALLLAAVLAVLLYAPGLPTSQYLQYRIALNRMTRMGLEPATDGASFSAPITRLELARLVNSCYSFTDTAANDPAGDEAQMNIALAQGYLQAVDGQADPQGVFTRGQAAAALGALLHLDGQPASLSADDVAEQDQAAVAAAVSGGYLAMKGRAFLPQEALTWGDAVMLLDKALGTVLCKPGPYTLRSGMDGNVTITCPGVALADTQVPGDVIVTPGAADGTVTLDGVTIGGRLVLRGGAGGVLLNNVICPLIVTDAPLPLRIVAAGSTAIAQTRLLSDARLEETGLTGDGFSAVTLAAALDLDGSLGSLTTTAAASANLSAAARVTQLTVDGDFTLTGEGSVETLTIEKGVTTSQIIARTVSLAAGAQAVFGELHLPAGPVSVTGENIIAVLNDFYTLSPGYAIGDDADHVRNNLTLPASGEHGSDITWHSSNEQYVTSDGVITRADYPEGDRLVTLRATVSSGAIACVRFFGLTVLQKEITPQQSVEADAAALMIQYGAGDSESYVTHDVVLPTQGPNGTTITWKSSHPATISETGEVNRPTGTQNSGGDRTVTLTATVTKQDAAATRTITLVVKKRIQLTDQELLAEDKEKLYIVYAPGDSASRVTQSVLLPGSGVNGSKVTWKSSNTAVIAANGTVTLPAPGSANVQITLTATLTIGSHATTKTFTVTVIAPEAPPTAAPTATPTASPTATPTATPAPTS